MNNQDCASSENQCSPHGTCVDKPAPTGDHLKDFSCDCDSGFEEKVHASGKRSCENIPDCPLKPKMACLPGTCSDLVNDYRCNCPEGYLTQPASSATANDFAHDCYPKLCGKVPTVEYAKSSTDVDVYYAMPSVEYTCEKGYTIDGSVGGEMEFSITCQADGKFSELLACEPVACGAVPQVKHAMYPAGSEFFFPQTVNYE